MRRRPEYTIPQLLAIVCLAVAAQGALPDNDNFETRTRLFGTSVATTGSNVEATRQIGEPDPNFTGGRSVWWTWTAPTDGYLTVTTAGSSFDTMLTVFTGSALSNLTLVAFNDTEGAASTVNFNVTAGTSYQIAVDGADDELIPVNNARGAIALQLTLGPKQTPPANDNFANRTTISGSHINNVSGSNLGASSEPGEPFHADTIGLKSVWWTWTAPASGALTLSSQGSEFDTVMAVYTGNAVANLTMVAANDEDPVFGFESYIECNVTSGVTYQIAVDGYEGDAGSIRFDLDLGAALPVPANDNFANRITLTGSNITTNWSNVGATYEPGEPIHLAILGGKSVWWKWTAPASGGVTLTVSNNALDTLVAVYKGTALNNLTFVAGNDEDYFLSPALDGDSTAYFNAVNGTTYLIAVDGVDGNAGNFQLRLTLGAADSVPANDNFANSVLINGTNTTVNGVNLGATLEPGEPLHRGFYGGSSVWWRWTAPGPGMVTIDTSNNIVDAPDTLLAVYTGSSLSTLTEIASDNNSGGTNWTSLVSFPTKSNVTYRIAVDGYDGDAWINIKLRVRFGLASYGLTVVTNPVGAGTVTVNPAPDQGGKYAPGSIVTLTAVPGAGSTFTGWSGDVNATNNPLVITMNANKSIQADYSVLPTTKVWSGDSPSGGNWTDGQNWGGVPPNAGDDLIFPPGALRRPSNTNNFPANTIFNSITVGGADYILRGNAVALIGGIGATNGTGTNTINLGVQLNSNQGFRSTTAGGTLAVSGNVALGMRTLTAEAAGDLILSGVLSGTGQLLKTGTGTLTLTANNTYTGQTTVSNGTLLVNGTQAGSAVVVNGPGVLRGSGRVGNLSGPGVVSPGASPGMLSSGNVTFSANTVFRVELNGTAVGSGYDQLNVSGTVSLAGTLNATLGFTPALNDSFTIINNDASDTVTGTFNGLPQGGQFILGGVVFQISYASGPGANDVVLTRVTAAPPTIGSITIQTNAARIQGSGLAGLAYVLERTAALSSPITWTPVSTNTAGTNGAFQFIDGNVLTFPARFYRVRGP